MESARAKPLAVSGEASNVRPRGVARRRLDRVCAAAVPRQTWMCFPGFPHFVQGSSGPLLKEVASYFVAHLSSFGTLLGHVVLCHVLAGSCVANLGRFCRLLFDPLPAGSAQQTVRAGGFRARCSVRLCGHAG
eukprot:3134201-Pyramimonas_sp.AAC.1